VYTEFERECKCILRVNESVHSVLTKSSLHAAWAHTINDLVLDVDETEGATLLLAL
jgi:hypothetical protein